MITSDLKVGALRQVTVAVGTLVAEAVASVLQAEEYFWLHLPFFLCKQKKST